MKSKNKKKSSLKKNKSTQLTRTLRYEIKMTSHKEKQKNHEIQGLIT